MKKVFITPGCISCGSCQFICPAVFNVTTVSEVIPGVDYNEQAEGIKKAAAACPVQVIKYEE
jgi:ferredoxin